MNRTRKVFSLSVGLMLAFATSVWSVDPKPETPGESRAAFLEDISTAHELAAFAAKYKSPEAYITAAGLLLKVEAQTKGKMKEAAKEVTVIDANNKETKQEIANSKLSSQAKSWFDDARGLATDAKMPKEVEMLIKAAEKRAYIDPEDKDVKERGKHGGPANHTKSIQPNETHVYHWKFEGDEWAAVGMTTGSRLGIKIVGPNGGDIFALVGGRANYRWMPKKDGVYIIRIHNGTNQVTTYNVGSN